MTPDIAAIRARAGVAVYLEEWDKLARVDVPALCDRVEALEKALEQACPDFMPEKLDEISAFLVDCRIEMAIRLQRARAALGDEP